MRWSPDTCECEFEFDDWDSYSPTQAIKCSIHAGMSDGDAMKHAHLAVNVPKNRAHAAIGIDEIDLGDGVRIPSMLPDEPGNRAAFGSTPGVAFWKVLEDGEVEVDLPNHTAREKLDIDTAIANDAMLADIRQRLPEAKPPRTRRG